MRLEIYLKYHEALYQVFFMIGVSFWDQERLFM